MQGQILPHRFEFEPDGMPIAKPRFIEQRVKLLKLLTAGGYQPVRFARSIKRSVGTAIR